VESGIKALLEQARPGDVVVLGFSGHGNSVPGSADEEADGANEFLYPHDHATAGLIRDDTLAAWLRGAREGVSLHCLFDACHAGTMPDSLFKRFRRVWRHWLGARPARAAFGRVRRLTSRAVILSACADHEEAHYDPQGAGGMFTRCLLAALERRPEDASIRQVMDEVTQAVFHATGERQTPQMRGPEAALARPLFREA
jgi:hypothetical protein